MVNSHCNRYLFLFCIIALFLVTFSFDTDKTFAQNELNNTGITATDENIFQNTTEEASPFASHVDSLNRFSLMYPEDWYVSEDDTGTLSIESPKENETDLYVDVFLVSSSNMSQLTYLQNEYTSFDDIIQKELDNLRLVNDFQLIESNTINLNKVNNPTHKFVYTYSDPSIGNAKALDIIIKKDDKLYYLTYITKPTDYSKNLPLIQKILDSFEFRNGITDDNDKKNIDGSTLSDSLNTMDDFFGDNLDKYQQQFNEQDILSGFGKSLSNSIFNDTSIFALLSYSLVDNVKVAGAQVIDNNSINVTIRYDNKNNSITTTPSVTVVAHKLDIDISDLFSFLSSAVASSEDMMMNMPSNNLFPFNNNMPIFDMVSNFKLGSNIVETGWISPHDISIKVTNGGVSQNESDTSIVLIELIPKE